MATTWNKKERENKKRLERKKKEEKKLERKENTAKGKPLDDMLAYVDENGNLSATPPNPLKKKKPVDASSIQIGVPKQDERTQEEELIRKGVIKFFNDQKGFGFIEDSVTREQFFVHQKSASTPLRETMTVFFEIEKGPRGLSAVNVKTA